MKAGWDMHKLAFSVLHNYSCNITISDNPNIQTKFLLVSKTELPLIIQIYINQVHPAFDDLPKSYPARLPWSLG